MAIAPVLEASAIHRRFGRGTASERIALDGVSLTLTTGEFAVVIGGNGAGKSTFLNVVAGDARPDSGTIRIQGEDVTAHPTHKRARDVARVFQDPSVGTAGSMTIEENLSLAERRGRCNGLRGGLNQAGRERYRARLADFGLGLEDRLGQKVELLSGGQRQSLALAMATLRPPTLLLLDEHTAALDPRAADLVMRATVDAVERATSPP